ncbi:MAG: DUF4282 domain-containing protein [Desulfobacteraceae bacterium]|nr:DUF4282 domain-containing protein [Desulfobacteraceae bacterium]
MADSVNDMLNVRDEATGYGSPGDFLTFRKMITPVLIQIFFWIGVIACVAIGIINLTEAYNEYAGRWNEFRVIIGLAYIILGPLFLRIYCEFIILFFRMNETLTEIKNKMK